MEIRPYLTFNGSCAEAVELYKRAFDIGSISIMRFSDIPGFDVPPEYGERIAQATMMFGDNFIRMSDRGPNHAANTVSTDLISIAVEGTVEETRRAFEVLADGGRIGMALAKTFYSPCAGVVYDKFGIMWNFSAKQ